MSDLLDRLKGDRGAMKQPSPKRSAAWAGIAICG